MTAPRIAALLAGLWAGVLLAIGAIAAPAAFAVGLPSEAAGRVAGRMFQQEAYAGLAVAIVVLLLLRRSGWHSDRSPPRVDANQWLVLGTLFCTVAGYFALQPMMAAARVGQGALSFGALHGLSAGFFVLKGLLVLALAWRLVGVSPSRPS